MDAVTENMETTTGSPILLELYAALEDTIESEDDDYWDGTDETPEQVRDEKRAAMKAVYDLALYHWLGDWRGEHDLAEKVMPAETDYTIALQHERLYTCGLDDYPWAIKQVAQGTGEGLPPDWREFLMFMGGVCVSMQADVLKSFDEES
jgi:hypothetical protein